MKKAPFRLTPYQVQFVLIIGFVIFILVKGVNTLKRKPLPPPSGPPTGAWEQRAPESTAVYPELIADAPEAEAQWFRRTGIYPIHGLIVVKTAVLAQHPFIAKSLFDAFLKAKDAYIARLKAGEGDSADDVKYRKLMTLVSDPLPYGMAANRASIEALVTYSLQQKLIPSRPQLDQVFVEIDP